MTYSGSPPSHDRVEGIVKLRILAHYKFCRITNSCVLIFPRNSSCFWPHALWFCNLHCYWCYFKWFVAFSSPLASPWTSFKVSTLFLRVYRLPPANYPSSHPRTQRRLGEWGWNSWGWTEPVLRGSFEYVLQVPPPFSPGQLLAETRHGQVTRPTDATTMYYLLRKQNMFSLVIVPTGVPAICCQTAATTDRPTLNDHEVRTFFDSQQLTSTTCTGIFHESWWWIIIHQLLCHSLTSSTFAVWNGKEELGEVVIEGVFTEMHSKWHSVYNN